MEDNPYVKLVERLKKDNNYNVTYRLGRVVSTSPLKVEVENLIFSGDELLKSKYIYKFNVGEELLLIPIEDEQRFIIVTKVVEI